MVITFGNQKGGVGKTTLCTLFANYLASIGKKTLVVDCDNQQTITEKRKADKKKAMFSLCVLIAFVLLFVICWFLGSPEKIQIIGYEGTDNQGFWAQLSDMMMYASYALVCGVIIAIIYGAIRSLTLKK